MRSYKILDMNEQATLEEINNKYTLLLDKYDERKYANSSLKDIAKQKREAVIEAYNEIIGLKKNISIEKNEIKILFSDYNGGGNSSRKTDDAEDCCDCCACLLILDCVRAMLCGC